MPSAGVWFRHKRRNGQDTPDMWVGTFPATNAALNRWRAALAFL